MNWVVLLVAGRHRRWGLTEARPTLMVGVCGYSAMAPHSTPMAEFWWGMGIPGRLRRASVGWRARGAMVV